MLAVPCRAKARPLFYDRAVVASAFLAEFTRTGSGAVGFILFLKR